jgi:hypothetical protein
MKCHALLMCIRGGSMPFTASWERINSQGSYTHTKKKSSKPLRAFSLQPFNDFCHACLNNRCLRSPPLLPVYTYLVMSRQVFNLLWDTIMSASMGLNTSNFTVLPGSNSLMRQDETFHGFAVCYIDDIAPYWYRALAGLNRGLAERAMC